MIIVIIMAIHKRSHMTLLSLPIDSRVLCVVTHGPVPDIHPVSPVAGSTSQMDTAAVDYLLAGRDDACVRSDPVSVALGLRRARALLTISLA